MSLPAVLSVTFRFDTVYCWPCGSNVSLKSSLVPFLPVLDSMVVVFVIESALTPSLMRLVGAAGGVSTGGSSWSRTMAMTARGALLISLAARLLMVVVPSLKASEVL